MSSTALLRRGLPLPAALRLDSTATPNKNIQTEEYNMTTINLRELYPWYTEDTFIEVSDEVAAFLEEDKRLQINYAQYIRDNKAFYSLDAGDGIEAEAMNWSAFAGIAAPSAFSQRQPVRCPAPVLSERFERS